MTGTEVPGVVPELEAQARALGVPRRSLVLHRLRELAVILVFLVLVLTFSVVLPGRFPTFTNVRDILVDAVVLSTLAAGLTVVLALGEFDLSFAAVVGLSGAVAVDAMHSLHQGAVVAVLCALGVGAGVGVANGLIVGYGRVPAFIGTLAMSSLATGAEEALMNDNTVYQGITHTYLGLTTAQVGAVPIEIFYGAVVVTIVWIVMSFTVFGRRTYAVGNNEEAARIAGIRTKRVKLAAFVVLGICGGIAGVLVTSQGASYYANSGAPFLLPAYGAAFLGMSAIGGRRFHPVATAFGVIFTGVLATGLTMLNAPPASTALSEGAVLAVAVLIVRPRG